jgi:polo-like kinase 1
MLVGKHPFESESEGKTRRTIKKVQWSLPKDEERFISEDARDLVSRLLHPIKEKRPKLQEIESHAFFRRNKIPVQLPMFCYSVMPNEESHGVMWKKVENRTKVISA